MRTVRNVAETLTFQYYKNVRIKPQELNNYLKNQKNGIACFLSVPDDWSKSTR